MAQSIYKYVMMSGIENDLLIPAGAQTLAVMEQNGSICLWAMVDPTAGEELRRFRVVGTGWELDDSFMDRHSHVGSCQTGPFVWHVFEEKQA